MDSSMAYGRVAMKTGAFTPLQIPGCKLWCRSDLDLVMNGTGVSQWTDQSGFGNHLTQSTAAAQPTVTQAALNGIQGLTFLSTVPQYLQNAAFTFAQPTTYFIVSFSTAVSSTRLLTDGVSARNALQVATAPDSISPFAGSSISVNFASGTSQSPMVTFTTYNGASSLCRVNGGIYTASGNAGTAGITGLLLGARLDFVTTACWNGHILEVAFWPSTLAQVYVDQLEDYARTRYALW